MTLIKSFTFLILLTAHVCGYCQNSTLPSVYVDSLILETKLNRECWKYADQLVAENIIKDSLLLENEKAIKLQTSEINDLRQLDWELGAQAVSRQKDFKIIKRKQRRTAIKLGTLAAIEAVIIILLL